MFYDVAPRVEKLLRELRDYLAQHPQQRLFCNYEPLPGLLPLGAKPQRVYRNGRSFYQTPWGLAESADISYTRYPELAYMGLQVLVEPSRPNADIPLPVVPELATVVVNPLTGAAAVYPGHLDNFDGVAAAWVGKIELDTSPRNAPTAALSQVRQHLCQAGIPLYPSRLFVEEGVQYPWMVDGWAAKPPTIANQELTLPVAGYVVDTKTDEVIYLSVVGHKTATRSIWGSLSTNHRRVLTLNALREFRVESSHNYTTFTTVLDADTGLQRLQIVDRRVFAGDVADTGAYLVIPQHAAVDVPTALAARLQALLPIAIQAHWDLLTAGEDLRLIRRCAAGGDVAQAFALTADPAWLEVIHAGITAGTLKISD